MRKYVVLLLLPCWAMAGFAQPTHEIDTTIRGLERLAVQGILTADTHLLKRVWAPEFMVNTPRNSIAGDRAAVFTNQKAGLIDYKTFERIIERMLILDDVVVTMGYELYVPNRDLPEGKAGQTIRRRFTNIWTKRNGGWQQIARHASIICQ